jgi:hypothetical protein
MNRDAFGYILEEVLGDLPPKAEALVRNVGFRVETRPRSGPVREADWRPQPRDGVAHLSVYWKAPSPELAVQAISTVTLYVEPILAGGGDAAMEIRRVILRTLERAHGLDPGALERPLSGEFAAAPPEEEDADEPPDLPEPGSPEALVESATCDIDAFPPEERDWLDTLEIVAIERPEAPGDPRRLADYPEPGDDPRVLVLYAENIRREDASPGRIVLELLHEALARRA